MNIQLSQQEIEILNSQSFEQLAHRAIQDCRTKARQVIVHAQEGNEGDYYLAKVIYRASRISQDFAERWDQINARVSLHYAGFGVQRVTPRQRAKAIVHFFTHYAPTFVQSCRVRLALEHEEWYLRLLRASLEEEIRIQNELACLDIWIERERAERF